jgi:hypothetical protein
LPFLRSAASAKPKPQTLINEYDALNATAQGYVNVATDYTYDYTDATHATKVNVTVNYMVAQLRVIAASGSGTASIADTIHENSGLYITLGVLAAGLTAAGAMIFIVKKRKHAIR